MKITFLRGLPDKFNKPFGVYQYDERLVREPGYIDIKGIIKEKTGDWLDEIQRSHARLSEEFLRYTRWWWAIPASRLDLRPWGQEHIFKPLFFARAVLEWMESNPDVDEILVIGCDAAVAVYLKEFRRDMVFRNGRGILYPAFLIFKACKNSLSCVKNMFRDAIHILRHHAFHNKAFIKSQAIALYELFPNTFSLADGYKYFYGSLFDSLDSVKADTVSYGCIEDNNCRINKLRSENDKPIFFLLDNVMPGDLAISVVINTYLFFAAWIMAFRKIPCTIGGRTSRRFWLGYLFNELNRMPCLRSICSYRALRSILTRHTYKLVIYPYEEKGFERAILFACRERNVATVGYTPHPQHRLAAALRDTHEPMSPKPSGYAVCGPAYVDYFESWGKKERRSISIWGSAKSFSGNLTATGFPRSNLKILLLLSHPNELRVFHSWLRAEERISHKIDYSLRIYKAVQNRIFSNELIRLLRDFACVREVHGNLAEDLSRSDAVIFCGTSAGLVAVNHGLLAVHVSLDDFFQINPCFDELDPMLSCETPNQFADLLEELRAMDDSSITELRRKQRSFVARIFSPIQSGVIRREIASYSA